MGQPIAMILKNRHDLNVVCVARGSFNHNEKLLAVSVLYLNSESAICVILNNNIVCET